MASAVTGAPRVALVGFGEVGQRLARDLATGGATAVSAWDIRFPDPDSAPSRAATPDLVRRAASATDAVCDADVIICAVTAGACLEAVRDLARGANPGAYVLDLNSVSPKTKCEAASIVEHAGGRYVEASVMSPIAPCGIGSPILLGGPRAAGFAPLGIALGFTGAQVYSEVTGQAAAAKMCRSVLIKGLEALLTESLVSARRYGVEQTVLDSLGGLMPGTDWSNHSRYMITRALEHGTRRAEEMREVALTVADTGLQPWLSEAIARRQDWCAALGQERDAPTLGALLDALLNHIPDPRGGARC